MSTSDISRVCLVGGSLANPSKKQYVHRTFLMGMLSFLKSDRLSPEWRYSASGIIWRMVLAEHGTLVGECRDPETKIASFFCLDMASGKVLWKDLRLDEAWWVGIEAVQKNVVILHLFAKPDMPEHRGIRAFDVASGLQLWQNDDVAYWFGNGDRVIAYRDFFERRVGYEIDLQSGRLINTYEGTLDELHELRRHTAEDQTLPEVRLPEIFVEDSEPALAALVRKETKGKEISGRVEYVCHRDVLVFNFHLRMGDRMGESPKLENNLVVYRLTDKKRVFAEVIGRDLTAYVPDSFFAKDRLLFFVQDRKILTALRLWKS
jgi:hypothetical protein